MSLVATDAEKSASNESIQSFRSSLGFCGLAGATIIALTWVYLVVLRPSSWEEVGGSKEAIITLIGYVGGVVLLLIALVPRMDARTLTLMPVALALNILVGQFIGSSGIPLYLDSIGTVLVAVLCGSLAGLATGAMSSIVWGLFNPAALPFAAVSAAVGWLAGLIAERGGFKKLWSVLLSGAVVGLLCGALAAPVAAFVYGGTAGVGTGAVVALFREMGNSLLQSVTLQSFISDPLDKAAVFFIVWLTLATLPKKVTGH